MTETVPPAQSSSLRRLVPRIFSRSARRDDVEQLLRTVRTHHPKGDLSIIERAYRVADEAHTGQTRQSGEPYITHPLAVAQILADLGLGPKAIAAALLHDTVEDTGYALETLNAEFGDEVAMLVDGVTKLDKVKYGESAQAETVRKMIVAMSRDIRVLLIKLADRLHNARTWGFVPPEKAQKKATETLEIYAPLAHRLGIQTIKSELEDLSFAVLHPKLYAEIESLVKQRTPQREQYVHNVIEAVDADLRELRIRGRVMGRPKQLYSVYQKMVVRGREFDDIYDLIGIRIMVGSVRDCYAVLGAIHARWTPLPGRFKDYIATPKFNLYQSLHTTVIGPGGRTVEIQIRTNEMHQQAEYGVAAHWKYKERMTGGKPDAKSVDADMAWLAHISDWQAETADPGEFLDSLRFEIGAKEVYVFTPKGRVIGLPDRREPGRLRVRGAHRGRPPHDGREGQRAARAARVRAAERRRRRGLHLEEPGCRPQPGLAELRQEHPRAQQDPRLVHEGAPRRGDRAGQGGDRPRDAPAEPAAAAPDEPGLVHRGRPVAQLRRRHGAVRRGRRGPRLDAVGHREGHRRSSARATPRPGRSTSRTSAARASRAAATRACSCAARPTSSSSSRSAARPVPGDEVVGFVTRGSGVSVHRTDCTNVKSLMDDAERLIEVEWAPTTKSVFLVQIQIEALDRSGLLSDVTRVLSEHHVNILSATVSTTNDRLALSRFVFEMGDIVHLERVLNAVRRIDAVYDVYRVTSS